MGTKYRKTHNGEPVKMDGGWVENCNGYACYPLTAMLADGYIEPVPTVMVELDREIIDRFLGTYGNARSGSLDYFICSAFRAALND